MFGLFLFVDMYCSLRGIENCCVILEMSYGNIL